MTKLKKGVRTMRRIRVLLLSAMFLFLIPAGAFATYIDFRVDEPFATDQPNGAGSYLATVDGLTISFTPHTTTSMSPTLWWDEIDGFGVQKGGGYEADEIEEPERLRVDFSSTVYVSSFALTDLFYEERCDRWYYERGKYSLDGGTTWNEFMQDDPNKEPWPNSNGEFVLWLNDSVSSVLFSALGRVCGEDHEFSVAGVDVNPVPEPATMLLLGTGLIGLAGLGRKKFFKKTQS